MEKFRLGRLGAAVSYRLTIADGPSRLTATGVPMGR